MKRRMMHLEAAEAASTTPQNSTVFDGGSADALSLSPSVTGDRQKFTVFGAVYASVLTGDKDIFHAREDADNMWILRIDDGKIEIKTTVAATTKSMFTSDTLSTDTWYGIMVSVDTTQATASNRQKIYFATYGIQPALVSAFDTEEYMAQNSNMATNYSAATHYISNAYNGNNDWNGLFCWLSLVDGQQLTPSDVFTDGDLDGSNINALTWGTNGVIFKSENASDQGEDYSGNGNDYTVGGTPTQSATVPS